MKNIIIFLSIILLVLSCNLNFDESGDSNNNNPDTENPVPDIPIQDPEIDFRVIGVTEGSVYNRYAKVFFYPADLVGTFSKDGGTPESFVTGHLFEQNGNYHVEVWKQGEESVRQIINFSVDTSYTGESVIKTNSNIAGARVEVEFLKGIIYDHAIPAFAVWVEDLHGNFLQNIYVSSYPATNYPTKFNPVTHPSTVMRKSMLPCWMHKAGSEINPGEFYSDPENNIPADLDAVTGATPRADYKVQSNIAANAADNNKVRIFFEIQQSFDKGWYFGSSGSGVIDADATTLEPSLIYFIELDLTRTGSYVIGGTDTGDNPYGYGHWKGENGNIYSAFEMNEDPTDPNSPLKYIFDHAPLMTKRLSIAVIESL